MKRIIMAIILVLLFSGMAFSLPGDTKIWKLTWDPNSDDDLAGYKVYFSPTDGGWNTTAMLGVTKSPAPFQTLTGVVPQNRYLCVTAVDLSGNESPKSVTIFFDKDITAPVAVKGLVIQ